MSKKTTAFIGFTIFMYIVLSICSVAERHVAVAVGAHSSQSFAAQIHQVDEWRAQELKTSSAEAVRTGKRILFARRATRAAIALLVSAFMVWAPRLLKVKKNQGSGESFESLTTPTQRTPP